MNVYRTAKGMETVQQAVREIYRTCPVPSESFLLDNGEFGSTHVLTAGKTGMPELVLLHGTSANSAAWFEYLPHWNERFRIYALDIPGEPGMSDERRPRLAGGGLTRWFGRTVAALGLERFHLAGMSLGGWLSLDWGVHQPQTIRSMVLLTPGGLAPFRPSFFFRCLPYYFQGEKGVRKLSGIVHGKVPANPGSDDFAVLAARHFRPFLEKVPGFSDQELHNINFPLLYFGGSEDPMLNTPASARRLEQMVPQAQIRILPGIAHVIPDQGKEIADFLESS